MTFLTNDNAMKIWLETMELDDVSLQDVPTNWQVLAEKATALNAMEVQSTEQAAQPIVPEQKPVMPPQQKADPMLKVNAQAQQNSARALAASAKDLVALQKAVEGFEGCALKKTATNTVFGEGNPNAGLMLIGEAPGADEDMQGKPFVGMSGQLLAKALTSIGIKDRNDYYITNMIPWRPPGNRQPSTSELAACLPFVERHIELVNPKVIAFVGGTAAKTLLQTNQGVTRLRGQDVYYTVPEEGENQGKKIRSLVLYHPAYLLRSPSKKEVFWHDLLTLKNLLDTL